MSGMKNTNRTKFWLVVVGLFLVIGMVAGGAYFLNDRGLITAGGSAQGEMPEGQMPEFEEGAARPERPDGQAEGTSFNSQALTGLLKVLLQITLVVVLVSGGQWLLTWLQRRRRRAPAQPA